MARIIIIYLLIGIIGAAFLYHLAKARGAKPWPWAVLGALTGPFVFFLIRWMSQQRKPEYDQDRFKK